MYDSKETKSLSRAMNERMFVVLPLERNAEHAQWRESHWASLNQVARPRNQDVAAPSASSPDLHDRQGYGLRFQNVRRFRPIAGLSYG